MLSNINTLKETCQQNKYEYLFFWKAIPRDINVLDESCLSQQWSSPFRVNGISYNCAEQYMMAEKARLFSDIEIESSILKETDPSKIKAFGRLIKGFNEDIWNDKCYSIVKRGNLSKFTQNPNLKQFLLSTQDKVLVEASPKDLIWGIGLDKESPDSHNPLKWKGTNLLGFTLMDVREELLSQSL